MRVMNQPLKTPYWSTTILNKNMWLRLWINIEHTAPKVSMCLHVCLCVSGMLLAILFEKETEQVSVVHGEGFQWLRVNQGTQAPSEIPSGSARSLLPPSLSTGDLTDWPFKAIQLYSLPQTHTQAHKQRLLITQRWREIRKRVGDKGTERGTVIVMVTVTAMTYLCFEWEGL